MSSINNVTENVKLEWYQHGLALLVCHAFCLFAAKEVLGRSPEMALFFVLIAQVFYIWAIVATIRYRHIDPWYRYAVPLIFGIVLAAPNLMIIFTFIVTVVSSFS